MKKFKVMLSVFMVLVIISISVAPVFATDSDSSPQDVIGENLKVVMSEAEENEKIKVYIWYKDIDQNEVDRLTTKETGLSPESCEVITEFPSADVWASLENGDKNAQKQMDEYMLRTKNAREKERNRTDTYSKKHREIANEKYRQKSQKIRQELYISESENIFSSEFAPMIIAEMTKDDILKASKNDDVELISYYKEPYFECDTLDSAITITQVDRINEGTNLNLTGENVKVGLIDTSRVSFSTEQPDYGIVLDNPYDPNVYYQNNVHFKDYGNVVVVGNLETPSYNGGKPHADKTSNSLLTVAPNIKLYTSVWNYNCVESMVLDGVQILSMSVSDYETVTESSDDFVYSSAERWFDHLVSYHGITVVKSAGNTGHNTLRVGNPGMAYNLITVGAYIESSEVDDHELKDELADYSLYLNSYDGQYGCEKPDVVTTANFNGGGTSNATPFLAGTIALMLELKPSLALYPQAVKAIVLASCHRKVIQTAEQGGQETMAQGITEHQGAGAPDAWTMACIISQGTYGVGALSSTSVSFNIIQPRYGADNMNVSLTWIRENVPANNTHTTVSSITAGEPANLSLSIYNGDSVIGASSLQYSSTEMCYVPLSATDSKYKFTISQAPISVGVRFGYAWSTDDMKAAPVSNSGIYHISNKANGRYMTYNQTTSEHQAVQRAVTTQAAFSDMHNWVVKSVGDAYNLVPGGATTSLYLGVSTTLSGTSYKSKLDTVATPLKVEYNEDGTYSILNSTRDKILSYSGSSLVWNTYDAENSTPATNESWYFAKVNYLVGDANADGYINASDATYIQNYLVGLNTPNNIRLYLSDADRDGVVSILDVYKINNIISGTDPY